MGEEAQMSSRKSPYLHPVTGHYRDGKWIEDYKRGHGDKPKAPSRVVKSRRGRGGKPGFNVSFPEIGENYNVGGGTLTGAIREAITRIQRPVVPTHARIRRLKK